MARWRTPPQQAGFLLPLSSTAALMLLLSSLSLQTASLQVRRQLLLQVQQRQQQDLLASAAHQLVGRLRLEHPCLLQLEVQQWPAAPCLAGQEPQALQEGQIGEHAYRLLSWRPTGVGVELQLALAAGGPTAAFALVEGELRELGLRAATPAGGV